MHAKRHLPVGDFLDNARDAALAYYTRELMKYAPQLRRGGQQTAKSIIGAIKAGKPNDKPGLIDGMPSWAKQLAAPIVEPYVAGLLEEVRPLLVKSGLAVGGAVSLVFLGGYLLGRR